MAVQPAPGLPARPRIPLAKAASELPYAVLPVDYGAGRDYDGKLGWYVVCEAPPGQPLGSPGAMPAAARAEGQAGSQAAPAVAAPAATPWREQELVSCVLLPAASALLALQERGLTHRAINPENLFRQQPGMPVTLGPFFLAPPASLQPAAYEPPYVARCLRAGRGDGTIADDIYALGVTLMVLASGRLPMGGADDETVLRRKIELGSYTALTAEVKLPPLIADLLRSMLAEDPEHRPPPKLLLNPEQARARRIAARPPRRAHTGLNVGGAVVTTARSLAQGLGARPDQAFPLLKNGAVERWLRRALGDPQLGMTLEEVVHQQDALASGETPVQRDMLVMLAVCAIDPLAPLVWRGVAVQPDGLAAALAEAAGPVLAAQLEIVTADVLPAYLDAQQRRPELARMRDMAREFRRWLSARMAAGGPKRLIYAANPLLPCGSPLLPPLAVVQVADLLPALNEAAAAADLSAPPIDADIAAFIAARAEAQISAELAMHKELTGPAARLAVLRLFGRMEARLQPGPLPGLAKWLLASGFATLNDWRSRSRRAALEAEAKRAAEAGQIGAILALVDDEAGRRADTQGAEAAAARLAVLEAALADLRGSEPRRARAAQRLGYELATAAGLVGLLAAVFRLALP